MKDGSMEYKHIEDSGSLIGKTAIGYWSAEDNLKLKWSVPSWSWPVYTEQFDENGNSLLLTPERKPQRSLRLKDAKDCKPNDPHKHW